MHKQITSIVVRLVIARTIYNITRKCISLFLKVCSNIGLPKSLLANGIATIKNTFHVLQFTEL